MSWFCVSGQELEYGHLSLEALMEGVLSQYSGDVLVLHWIALDRISAKSSDMGI